MQVLQRIYGTWLERLEWAILATLLALVAGLSFTEILNRNLVLHLWDAAAVNRVVFSLTFYLGLYGAVAATRYGKHIRIDAVAPYVSERTRAALEVIANTVGVVACLLLAGAAYRYVTEIVAPDDRFLPESGSAFWRVRTWKWPMVVAFVWMALHFAVGAAAHARKLAAGAGDTP